MDRHCQTSYELLVHAMPEGVIVVDGQGNVQFANPAAAAILGLPVKGLTGHHFGVPANGVSEIEVSLGGDSKILEIGAVGVNWSGQGAYLATLRDITRQRLGQESLRTRSRRLVEALEKERRDIGHELHDQLGGALTSIKLALGATSRKLGGKADPDFREADDLLGEAMDLVSALSLSMWPDILDEFGLVEALRWRFERYTRETGVAVRLKESLGEERYPDIIEITAYRIIEESLTNAARHAGVSRVTVAVGSSPGKLSIQVRDRGRGFAPEKIGAASSGISIMQGRAFLIGGELIVDSSPGKGTCVTCELPSSIA